MGRNTLIFSLLFLAVSIPTPTLAQDQREPSAEQGTGQGFRGGRGPGFGGGRGFGAGQGFGRGMRIHAPQSDQAALRNDLEYPVIASHGGVLRLPNAAMQPRAGTKLLVDLTSGSDPDKLNGGLVKVAKYANVYAGAGAEPADVKIAVVFHGDATLVVLAADAYSARFKTDGNPNLQVLQQLREAGVEMFVCGQSLLAKGATVDQVADSVKTAVSAITAVVNLQADGYAYVPITSSEPEPLPRAFTEEARGHGPMQGDMATLHAMFSDRDKIKRSVKNLPDGAEAVTESDDEAIAEMLKEHVPAMEDRVLSNKPLPPMTFHPIFVELIKHAKDYTLAYEETDKGVKVTYQSDDPYVVMLVQEHAKLVSRFIKNGMEEIHKPYTLPKSE